MGLRIKSREQCNKICSLLFTLTDSDLMITIIESVAQAENESRSENIKWGIKQRAASGSSKLYDRKCYGYKHDKDGKLVIDEETADC